MYRSTSTVTIRLTEKETEWLRRFAGMTLSDTIRALIKYDMENNLLNYNDVKNIHNEKKSNRKNKAKISGVLNHEEQPLPETLFKPVSKPVPYVPIPKEEKPVKTAPTQPKQEQQQKQTEIPAFLKDFMNFG